MKKIIKNTIVKPHLFQRSESIEIEVSANREEIIRLAKILNELDQEQKSTIKDFSCEKKLTIASS